MATQSHPDNRSERKTEKQKAEKLCKEQRKKEKNKKWVKVEGGIQNLYKLV